MSTLPIPADVPSAVRALVGASMSLLVRADDAAEWATGASQRFRERSSALLPAPRRPYDEL